MYIRKLKADELFFLFFVTTILLSGFLEKVIGGAASYLDEFLTLVIIIRGIYTGFKTKFQCWNNIEKMILILFLIFCIIGFWGSHLSGFQKESVAILVDCFSWTKLIIVFVCLFGSIKNSKSELFYRDAVLFSKIVIIFCAILEIGNQFFEFQLTNDAYDRFGIEAFSIPGHHVSYAAAVLACTIIILILDYKKNKKWLICACIICMATLRFKAIGFVILVIMSYLYMKKKIKIGYLMVIAAVIFFVSRDAIYFYFGRSTSSRAKAMSAGIQIAKDYFPLGSGFASFGTSLSGQYYSEAYYTYHLSNRWGFMPDHYGYIGDGGIATLIGQFGILGLFLFVLMILLIIFDLKERIKNFSTILPFVTSYGYLLIAATSEQPFNSDYTILLSLAIIVVGNKMIAKSSKEKYLYKNGI